MKLKNNIDVGQNNMDMLRKRMQDIDAEFDGFSISKDTVKPTPIADFYQSSIRPALSNAWQSDKSIEALGQTPLRGTPVYSAAQAGRGIIGMGGKYLESLVTGITGGSPEEYQMRTGIASKQEMGQPLSEGEADYMKQLDDEFMLGVGTMTGSISPSKFKLTNKDVKELSAHYKYISNALAGGNYEGARKLTEALPDKQAKEVLAVINNIDPNYVSKVSKKVKHLRNAVGNRYAGSESITSLANIKN